MVKKFIQQLDDIVGSLFGLIGLVFFALFVFSFGILLITIIGILVGVLEG